MNGVSDAGLSFVPEVTDADVREAERRLGVTFDGVRQDILRSNESFDVHACPGSGKTTLLVAKLAVLAEKWPHARRGICVLSHTNVARLEIEKRLTGTAAGQRLLAYPHFVGTIHGFVNEFLSLPLLRSEGRTVRLIDDETCGDFCRRLLYSVPAFAPARLFLASKEQHNPDRTVRALKYQGKDLTLGSAAGEIPCGPSTESFRVLQKIKEGASERGLWRYDDMFGWAERLLAKHPEIAEFACWRFPFILIDEMQDTSEIQGALLATVFPASSRGLRQRFGDSNQAIFDFGQAKATTDPFPSRNARPIPNSQRFGPDVAAKVRPFAPDPPKPLLVGEGPRKDLFPVRPDHTAMPHTVFLFAEDSAPRVLPAFASILLETFPDTVIHSEEFVARAIGRVGRSEADVSKVPRHLGDYWVGYEPRAAKLEPHPQTLAGWVRLAQRRRSNSVDCALAVKTVGMGLADLFDIVIPNTIAARSPAFPWLWDSIKNDESALSVLHSLLWSWCVELALITEEDWPGQIDGLRRAIRPVIVGQWNIEADAFCRWSTEDVRASGTEGSPACTTPNRFRFSDGVRSVDIDVGTIHSAKGQTHTATLVMETFYRKHDLADLLEWVVDRRHGAKPSDGLDRVERMRLIYTAMTRPTHLVCLAMREKAIGQGPEAEANLEAIRSMGWKVRVL